MRTVGDQKNDWKEPRFVGQRRLAEWQRGKKEAARCNQRRICGTCPLRDRVERPLSPNCKKMPLRDFEAIDGTVNK